MLACATCNCSASVIALIALVFGVLGFLSGVFTERRNGSKR